MKKIVYMVLLSAVVLLSACKKVQCPEGGVGGACNSKWIKDHYAIGEDVGISYTDYNSVRDIFVHYAYDITDFCQTHTRDTILVDGYVGRWYWGGDFALSDTAIAPGYYQIMVECSSESEVYKKLREKDEACDGKLWIRAQFVLTSVHLQCWEPKLIILDTTLGGLI